MSSRTLPIVSSLLARKSIARTTSTARATATAHGWFGTSSVVSSSNRSVPIPLHTEWIPPEACESGTEKANTDEHYTVLFLHGLLGSGRNLKTFARKVVQQQSSNQGSCRGGILVDLRGHGTSFRTQKREEHSLGKDQANEKYGAACTFSDCARDIEHTLQQTLRGDESAYANANANANANGSPQLSPQPPPPARVLVGHSFGGRLALEYAAGVAETQPLEALWLLDTVPGEANETVDRVLATIANVLEDNKNNRTNENDNDNDSTTPPPTKKEIVSVLTEPPHGMDLPTAQWLAMSYDEKSGDNFGFDNDLVTRLKPEFRDQDFHGLLRRVLAATKTKNKNKTQVHVVRGGKNTGWSIPILSELEAVRREFPTNFHLHVLPSAGHNVHIDDLQGLVKLFDGR